LSFYQNKAYAKSFKRDAVGKSAGDIVDAYSPEKAAIYLAFLEEGGFDFDVVKKFLVDNFSYIQNKDAKSTQFKKLACMYDYFFYGWESSAEQKQNLNANVEADAL
jgi:hypothetical protein